MKRLAIMAAAAFLMVALAGCGGSAASTSASSGASSASSASASSTASSSAASVDFDGSGFADTGAGTMILRTAGGTSENGDVPEIPAANATMSLEVDLADGDGSVCTLYVDGIENTTMNFGVMSQNQFIVKGSDLEKGTHTVELVKMDGGAPVIYKKAEYKCV